ncbi:MAG: DUF4058 family protein [Gemmataceae bacterium]
MRSPFPGMDPYLEDPAFWAGFHHKFINYWQEALDDVLPQDYEATVGERVYLVEHDPDARRLIYPDLALSDIERQAAAPQRGATATLEPTNIPLLLLDGPREAYIEILKRPERSLVAVLELLSPANKENPGRAEYLSKRNALLHQNVHVVELDLLLGGKRVPFARPLPDADYFYLLSRAEERPNCKVYSWTLRDTLPTLPVPLRDPDKDVRINLAEVFTTTYEHGRYARRLDYAKPCPAPVRGELRAWVEEKARGTGASS